MQSTCAGEHQRFTSVSAVSNEPGSKTESHFMEDLYGESSTAIPHSFRQEKAYQSQDYPSSSRSLKCASYIPLYVDTNMPFSPGPPAQEMSERSHSDPCSPSSLFSISPTVSQSAEEETGDLNAEVDQPSGLNVSDRPPRRLAIRNAPLIRGLFLPSLQLPRELAEEVLQKCMQTYFVDASNAGNGVNQVMLFGRAVAGESSSANNITGLPPILNTLLESLSHLLRSHLPRQTHDLLFRSDQSYSNGTRGTGARQAILNLYKPGEGITPHVDLVGRFGDGIMGVSLGGGCVMNFERQSGTGQYRELEEGGQKRWDLYLPERSILVLSEEARYGWTHGIEKLYEDWVEVDPACNGQYYRDIANDVERDGEWVPRGVRLSITFRWLLPGADVVGH